MSNISCGIVGLPNVGKSTLFNALTKNSVLAANYPFATIEPNVGVVPVPDERLDKLAQLFDSENIVPATVSFTDIAGIVAGASKGEGLGNQFLSHIRHASIIVEVVRAFSDSLVTHVSLNASPPNDIETIATELVLADLDTVTRRLPILEKEAKANPKLLSKLESLKKIHKLLDDGKTLYSRLDPEEISDFFDLNLLTAKPIIYVFNVDEADLSNQEKQTELTKLVAPAQAIFISAKLESELSSIDDEDAKELRESYNIHKSGLEKLVSACYTELGLQSFLTAGKKEVRAWPIPIGSTAPQAAGVIHTDFERGFIAAEIVSYSDLIDNGSLTACRSLGKVRTEGKSYVMQESDVVEFRFNV